jgi:hypothetical protein
MIFGHVSQRFHILRKSTSAESDSGVQEFGVNTLIVAHSLHHFLHVRAEPLAK